MRAFILICVLFAAGYAYSIQQRDIIGDEYLTRYVRSADSDSSEEENEKIEAEGTKVIAEEGSGDLEDFEGSGARFNREAEGSGDSSSSSEEEQDEQEEASGERFIRDVEQMEEGSGEIISSDPVAVVEEEEGSGEGADATFFKDPTFFF